MMTPDEMRQEADMLENAGSRGRTAIWRSTAEICERLDAILDQLDRVQEAVEHAGRSGRPTNAGPL